MLLTVKDYEQALALVDSWMDEHGLFGEQMPPNIRQVVCDIESYEEKHWSMTPTQDRKNLEYLVRHCLSLDNPVITISRAKELLGFTTMETMREWLCEDSDSQTFLEDNNDQNKEK